VGVMKQIGILLRALLANRAALALENLALRQQLAVLERSVKRPACGNATASSGPGCPDSGTAGEPIAAVNWCKGDAAQQRKLKNPQVSTPMEFLVRTADLCCHYRAPPDTPTEKPSHPSPRRPPSV
jgi:hypothetical protein